MATEKLKLKWVDLSPEMFPANVQKAIAEARDARKVAAEKTAIADGLIAPFAPRIQVPNLTGNGMVPLVQPGESLVISHRFGKLTGASAPKEAKTSKATKAVLA